MESVSLDAAGGELRPSRLIAEALVLRHDRGEVEERAKALGLPEPLTQAVIGACCREKQEDAIVPSAR